MARGPAGLRNTMHGVDSDAQNGGDQQHSVQGHVEQYQPVGPPKGLAHVGGHGHWPGS
jgi:hypothetical protein